MCKCAPEIRTPFCGRGNCLPPGYANLGEWLGIFSDAEARETALKDLERILNDLADAEDANAALVARVAELEAAGKLLATQGREMATGLCSDTREVGATGVCVACQVRMARYLGVWWAALEGTR